MTASMFCVNCVMSHVSFGFLGKFKFKNLFPVVKWRPLSRGRVSKGRSAAKFRSQMRRTKAPNVVQGPMRGGWRL